MDEPTPLHNPTPFNLSKLTSCPYLGLDADPDTHLAFPGQTHICKRVQPAQYVDTEYQTEHCLTTAFTTCPVFLEKHPRRLPPDAQGEKLKTSMPALLAQNVMIQRTITWFRRWIWDPFLEQPIYARLSGILLICVVILLAVLFLTRPTSIVTQLPSAPAQEAAAAAEQNLDSQAAAAQATEVARRRELGLIVLPTKTQNSEIEKNNASTATMAAVLALPTATPTRRLPSVTPAFISPTAVDTVQIQESPTAAPASCEDASGYHFEIISGPNLSPPPTFTYYTDAAQPSPQATWQLRNTGLCEWNLVQLVNESGYTFKPFTRRDGKAFDLTNSYTHLYPEQTVDIVVGFDPARARTIQGSWKLKVNGILLESEPYLNLDVKDWIIGIKR